MSSDGVAGDGQQIDGALAGGETAGGEDHLIGLGLQQPGGDGLAFFDDLLRRLEQRGAAHVHRAGAAVAVAFGDFRCIGLEVTKLLQRQTEQVGGDLGIGGFVALAVALRADQQGDDVVVAETDFRALVRGAARGFQEAGNADAAQPALALRWRRGAAAKPAWSASGSTSSMLAAKRPQSTTVPSAFW